MSITNPYLDHSIADLITRTKGLDDIHDDVASVLADTQYITRAAPADYDRGSLYGYTLKIEGNTSYIHDDPIDSPTGYSLAEILYISTTEKIKDFIAKTGGTVLPDLKSLYDVLALDRWDVRLSATRAGYIDNLSGGAVALASICTEARLAELDAANIPADLDVVKADTPYLADAALPATPTADSIGDLVKKHLTYTTKAAKLYPLAAEPVSCSSSATAWAWGSWAELVPVDTITSDFIITAVVIIVASETTTRDWVCQIGIGAAGAEAAIIDVAGKWAYATTVGLFIASATFVLPVPIKITANTRVAVRATDDTASALNYNAKIQYIELPL